jgi:hypothetical protein
MNYPCFHQMQQEGNGIKIINDSCTNRNLNVVLLGMILLNQSSLIWSWISSLYFVLCKKISDGKNCGQKSSFHNWMKVLFRPGRKRKCLSLLRTLDAGRQPVSVICSYTSHLTHIYSLLFTHIPTEEPEYEESTFWVYFSDLS